MRVSPSSIKLFDECAYKYFLQHLRDPKIPQPIVWSMLRGTKVHSFVAYLHKPIKKGSKPRPYYFKNIKTARGAWFAQWNIAVDKDRHKVVEYSEENRKIFGTTGWECVLQYWKTMENIRSPLEVESRYSYPINSLVLLNGTIDQVRTTDILTLNKSGIVLELSDFPPDLYDSVIPLDLKTGYLPSKKKVLFNGNYELLRKKIKEIEKILPIKTASHLKKIQFYTDVIEFIVRKEFSDRVISCGPEGNSREVETIAERHANQLRRHIDNLIENSRWETDEEYLQRLKNLYDFEFDTQINSYYYLYKKRHGKLPLAFGWLHLPEGVFVVTTRDEEDLIRIEEKAIYVAEAIQAGIFPKTLDSYICKNRCGYYNFCLADRKFLTNVTKAIPATPEHIVKKAKKVKKKYRQRRLRGTSVPRVKRG